MAEHTYKPGDVVSVRTRLVRDDEPGFGFPGTLPQFTFRDIEPEYARWLSDEDQDSLLRVVKAAQAVLDQCECGAHDWVHDPKYPRDTIPCKMVGCRHDDALDDALTALPPHLVARLSEGE